MVLSKYMLPPYIVENTIPLSSSNDKQTFGEGLVNLPGVIGEPNRVGGSD